MVSKIGIDAGGSLIKVAYEENGHMHLKTYTNQEFDQLVQWLQLLAPTEILSVTGGKSGNIKNLVQNKVVQMDEFQALSEGTRYLLEQENKNYKEFILVSIGTGTSIFSVTQNSYERLLGSGIGGGTLMGLGKLITGENSFQTLVDLASKGDHQKSDLLVRDIYAPTDPPIMGDLTAANFGKAHISSSALVEDHMASLIKMVGETIILLASQAAISRKVQPIVFTGSTLSGNTPLRTILAGYQDMLPYEPIFLEKGSHAGAFGTLFA